MNMDSGNGWWHQAITWSNINLLSVGSRAIDLQAIARENVITTIQLQQPLHPHSLKWVKDAIEQHAMGSYNLISNLVNGYLISSCTL